MRRASGPDADEWARMRVALWPEGTRGEHAAEIADYFRGAGEPLVEVFVAAREDGRRLAGFLELSVRNYADGCRGPVPFVEGWYVDEDARGRGLGRTLMRAAESWARDHGFGEMASDAEIHNEGSLRAHRALGFEEVGRVVQYRKSLPG